MREALDRRGLREVGADGGGVCPRGPGEGRGWRRAERAAAVKRASRREKAPIAAAAAAAEASGSVAAEEDEGEEVEVEVEGEEEDLADSAALFVVVDVVERLRNLCCCCAAASRRISSVQSCDPAAEGMRHRK